MKIIYLVLSPLSTILLICRYCLKKTKQYYHGDQKNWYSIMTDLIVILLREKEFCHLYFALGYDQKGSTPYDYMGKKRIFALKERSEKVLKARLGSDLSYDVVTKDKFYADSILKANGMPSLDVIAYVSHGALFISGCGLRPYDDIIQLGDTLVFKNTICEASEGVFFVEVSLSSIYINGFKSSIEDLRQKTSNGAWVIQERYISHPTIAEFNASALNVMRVVTVYDGYEVKIIGCFQAFATGNAKTDSWSEGSIYIGVNIESGELDKYGFRSPWHRGPGLVSHHPDSQIAFEGYRIPFFNEIKGLCLTAHRLFYANYLLGWDIAITENGPLIVEVNEKPGMNVLQCILPNDQPLGDHLKNLKMNSATRSELQSL